MCSVSCGLEMTLHTKTTIVFDFCKGFADFRQEYSKVQTTESCHQILASIFRTIVTRALNERSSSKNALSSTPGKSSAISHSQCMKLRLIADTCVTAFSDPLVFFGT